MMKTMKILKTVLVAASILGCGLSAQAISILLGGPTPTYRVAELSSATFGTTGSGNATAAILNGIPFDGIATWTERADVVGGTGTSGVLAGGSLTVDVTSGSWGSNAAGGTWTINDAFFWSTYADAAISMHVGNGNGEPDHFIWHLEDLATSGTWSYDGSALSGGGLSNLKLYSSGTGSGGILPVPEASSTLIALGLALVAAEGLRRKGILRS